MKKRGIMLAVLMMSGVLTACGQKTEKVPETAVETENNTEAKTETSAETETIPVLDDSDTSDTQETVYEDNFAVDGAAAEDFAKKIQAAVAADDLNALAELAAYPLYVGFTDGGVSIKSAEEFVALGAERIFTAELHAAIEGAETGGLSPSMAGFSLSKDGKPNIVFGVRDGKLAVQTINY